MVLESDPGGRLIQCRIGRTAGRNPLPSAIAVRTVLSAILVASAATAFAEQLEYPVDVAIGPDGAILVADLEAAAVLRWNGAGFEVVARGEGRPRTPLFGIRHIAPDGDGTLVASDPATMALYRIDVGGGIRQIPDDQRFVTPWGIALPPAGGVLAVDRVTRRLRHISDRGIDDIAEIEAGRAILSGSDDELFVLTDRNILRVTDGAVEPLIQSPPFEFPHDLARSDDGTFFVTDGYARCIWEVSPGGRVSKFAEGPPFMSPQGIARAGDGTLLVADAHAKTIFRVFPDGAAAPLQRERN